MENPSQSYGASPAIWITQYYLLPDTGEDAPPQPQPDSSILDFSSLPLSLSLQVGPQILYKYMVCRSSVNFPGGL